ncbi:MAG: ParA family partition ATPase [Polyangiales bacterium]
MDELLSIRYGSCFHATMFIAITGQKGGVGKSTTAICLAVAAMSRAMRVLLVDADPQGTVRTWGEVASENGHCAPTIVAMGATMHRPGQLDTVSQGFDLTVIDYPPRHGDVTRAALMIADVAILPCGPTAADAWALSGALEVLAEARALRDRMEACVLITRKQGRTSLAKGARRVLESSGLPVLESELGYRVAYQEALAFGQGVTNFAPRDTATLEVFALLDELEARWRHFGEGATFTSCGWRQEKLATAS